MGARQFVEGWYGERLKQWDAARRPDAPSHAGLPTLADQVALVRWLCEGPELDQDEAQLPALLRRVIAGAVPVPGVHSRAVVIGEAARLLAAWEEGDRDQPVTGIR